MSARAGNPPQDFMHFRIEALRDAIAERRLEAGDLLASVLHEAAQALKVECAVLAFDENSKLEIEFASERDADGAWHDVPVEQELPSLSFVTGKPHAALETFGDVESGEHPLFKQLELRAFIAWPFWSQGRRWSCIFGTRGPREPFNESDMNVVISVVEMLLRVLELRDGPQTDALAYGMDPLTGLQNRAVALERIDEAIALAKRSDRKIALLYVDLDRFKVVNDSYGHAAGDAILREIAARMKSSLRPYDSPARIGGDEFAILIRSYENAAELAEIAERLVEAISQKTTYNDAEIQVSASVGIAIYPDDASSTEELLAHADTAMYVAKANGAQRYSLFDKSAGARARARQLMTAQLRSAHMDQQFFLCFQPILDARNGRVARAEALTRWLHPSLGLLLPSAYIGVARDNRLIANIDAWAVAQAVKSIHTFQHDGRQIVVHVNIASFDDNVLGAIEEAAMQRNVSLCIEVSEARVREDVQGSKSFFERCARGGVQIAMDGFGFGGLPVSVLPTLKVNMLKIAPDLTAQLFAPDGSAAVVEIAIETAKRMGWQIVAEGVHDSEQRRRLASLGADYVQGFGIGLPVTEIDFAKWIRLN